MVTLSPLTTRPLALVLLVPADARAVVGAPDPGVVDDGVVAVDLEVDDGACRRRRRRRGRRHREARWDFLRGWRWLVGADLKQNGRGCGPASKSRPAMMMPSASAVVMAGVPLIGMQRGEAKADDDGVGAGDADGFGRGRRCRG